MMTVREGIITYLTVTAEATSYDIFESYGFSSSQVDAQLKVLTEDGTLVREKKSTNGGRPVYHYKLANPDTTTVAMNGTKTRAGSETNSDFAQYGDAEEESNDEAHDAEAEVELAVYEPEPIGPKMVFLIRQDDQDPYAWATRQHAYARLLNPFTGGTRTFRKFGGTVPSIFITSSMIDEIAAKIQRDMPELTFGIATTVDEAVALINAYTPGGFNESYFRNWVSEHFRTLSHMLPSSPAPVRLQAGYALAEQQTRDTQAQTAQPRTLYAIMNDLAAGRAESVTEDEAKLAISAFAQDWLDNN